MSNEVEHAKVNPLAVEVRRSPNYREFYCNSTKIRVSPWDVVLKLLMHLESGPGTDAIAAEEQASITMSPQHFKAFAEASHRLSRPMKPPSAK
jgi:Protein of unknown function (DUF3467)